MAARKKPVNRQIDVIDLILRTEKTVCVHGQKITLKTPNEAACRRLRKLQFSLAPDDGSDMDLETLAETSLNLASTAVQACIDGLDEKRAVCLVMASGGERGELTRTAFELCGVHADVQATLADGEVDDPI